MLRALLYAVRVGPRGGHVARPVRMRHRVDRCLRLMGEVARLLAYRRVPDLLTVGVVDHLPVDDLDLAPRKAQRGVRRGGGLARWSVEVRGHLVVGPGDRGVVADALPGRTGSQILYGGRPGAELVHQVGRRRTVAVAVVVDFVNVGPVAPASPTRVTETAPVRPVQRAGGLAEVVGVAGAAILDALTIVEFDRTGELDLA